MINIVKSSIVWVFPRVKKWIIEEKQVILRWAFWHISQKLKGLKKKSFAISA